MREFSSNYPLHFAIALQNFQLVSLVLVASLFCLICSTNVRKFFNVICLKILWYFIRKLSIISITSITNIFYQHILITVCSNLTLSWWRPLSYKNQSIDLFCKSMDWFLYDNGLRHERVKGKMNWSILSSSADCTRK